MQGLVNFAGAIGAALAVLLPAFSYLSAIGLFLYAGWGFWMLARPDNPFRHRPWLPVVALFELDPLGWTETRGCLGGSDPRMVVDYAA